MIVINIQCSLLLLRIIIRFSLKHSSVRNSELERARHNIVMFLMCTGASDLLRPVH